MDKVWIECHFGHELKNGDVVICFDCYKEVVREHERIMKKLEDKRAECIRLANELSDMENARK